MRKELIDLLYQRYPAIFAEHMLHQEDEAYWQIGCGDGWFDLLDALCEQLHYWTATHHAPPCVAIGVTEKFGVLRFLAQHRSAHQIGALEMAVAMSTRICEECGAPGRLVVSGGQAMTRCEPHTPDGSISVEEYNLSLEKRQE